MSADLRAIRSWKTWFRTDTEEASLTALTPLTSLPSGAIGVHPYTAVAIRAFGKDANNDTAVLRIKGTMRPSDDSRVGGGPQQGLWYGKLSLGSTSYSSTIPLADGKWGAAATWYEVDSYDIGGVSGGYNAAQAVTLSGGNQAMLIVPTLGYAYLIAEFYDMGGAGTEMGECGILYRECSMGGVV